MLHGIDSNPTRSLLQAVLLRLPLDPLWVGAMACLFPPLLLTEFLPYSPLLRRELFRPALVIYSIFRLSSMEISACTFLCHTYIFNVLCIYILFVKCFTFYIKLNQSINQSSKFRSSLSSSSTVICLSCSCQQSVFSHPVDKPCPAHSTSQ